ncbi:sigma-54-dependent transcriptional regulator [Leeia oryzae]|uniref:sigma-54-dependent transcriptional regulator n=1 Tax=Leeia oryzae TaxID=356662 RepID=UPI0003652662|nr:sigma-54 dependent transcriptional regulator [Leeia oryzae]
MARLPVLVVEDDAALREAVIDTLELAGFETVSASDGSAALQVLANTPVCMVVSDVAMQPMDGNQLLKEIKTRWPHLPVLLMTAYGVIEHAVASMQAGAAYYLPKPFEPDALVNQVTRFALSRLPGDDDSVVAEAPATRQLLQLAERVAPKEATVLITGESGTGKEVLARFIHRHSHRSHKPFVAINCAAIPENLLEATLFGHEKGAFTGASQTHIGKFEQAQGGTLFLDEIAEMPLPLQSKLLRVLQEREVERVGGQKAIPLDVRILTATNRDLGEWVKEGKFREDLYYRLNVFPLHLPPLRDRVADIVPLARHALSRWSEQQVLHLSNAACQVLQQYNWPGNVRELENVIQRAVILCNGQIVTPDDLMLMLTDMNSHASMPVAEPVKHTPDNIKDLERQHILDTLAAAGGVRKLAAEKLGMSERTLRYKLAQYRDEGWEEDE